MTQVAYEQRFLVSTVHSELDGYLRRILFVEFS